MLTIQSLRWSISAILIFGPPYLFEALAEHFYLLHSGLFFFFSGQRFYFDIYYLAFAGGLLAYKNRNLFKTWLVYIVSVLVLLTLLYVECEPILCYSTGLDGLGPARLGSFLAAEGIAAAYLGYLKSGSKANVRWARLFAGGCAFYSIAYVPVIFTLAGATIFSPAGGFAFPAIIGLLSLTVAVSFAEREHFWTLLIPLLALGVLLVVGFGTASQYYQEILPSTGTAVVAGAVGTASAALILRHPNRIYQGFKRSRVPFTSLVAIIVIVSLVVWPDAVVGQVTSASTPMSPGAYSFSLPESAGGFMSGPMVHPTGVRVNVTLAGYDLASVPQGGFLAGGIGVHSADCCTDGIDYGYRFDVVLYGNGSQALTATAWKVCDANAACGGPTWKLLMYFASHPLPQSALGESIRLSMEWQNHSVVWEYGLGGQQHQLGDFAAPARANPDFNAGWLGPPDSPSPGGAFFFQFAVSRLGHPTGQWSVSFDCPAIFLNENWGCIPHAESLQGDQSYWKVLWRWGETLPGVAAQVGAPYDVTFHSSGSTMESFAEFW